MPTKPNKKLRLAVYKRDGFRCLRCGGPWVLTVDHIKPRSKGGRNAYEHLQTLCAYCNNEKGDHNKNDYRDAPQYYPSKFMNENYTREFLLRSMTKEGISQKELKRSIPDEVMGVIRFKEIFESSEPPQIKYEEAKIISSILGNIEPQDLLELPTEFHIWKRAGFLNGKRMEDFEKINIGSFFIP